MGFFEKKEGGSETFSWLEMTELKPMGLFEKKEGGVKFYIGWK